MNKRKTKAERESEAKAKLRARLRDILIGAIGGYEITGIDNEEESAGIHSEFGIDVYARWVGAIKRALLDDGNDWLTNLNNLEKFEYLSKATNFLYENGVRA